MKQTTTLLALVITSAAFGQASLSGTGYSQNFNGLDNFGQVGNGSRSEWIDDQTLDGWYTNIAPNAPNSDIPSSEKLYYIFNDPTTTSTKTRSIGSVGEGLLSSNSSDRALSFTGSAQDSSLGPLYVALRLRNDSGSIIDAIELAYTAEIWAAPRSEPSFNHNPSYTNVDYRLGGNTLDGGVYTSATDLGFVNSPKPFQGSRINGNLAENQIPVTGLLTGLSWAPGEDLWIRFQNPFSGRGQWGLSAIDDLSVKIVPQAVPEPTTLIALGAGAFALLRRRRNQ